MRFLRLHICIFSIILLCLSCTKDNEETPKITFTDIKFDTTDVSLVKGETKVLTVYYEPENIAVSKEVVTLQYSKDDIVVVSLDSIGNGKATIKVYARDTGALSLTFSMVGDTSKKAIVHIRVIQPNILAEGIQLDKAIINIELEKTDTIKARIIPQNATDKTIVWTSDNEAIAQISTEGIITALKVGKATITATLGSNAKISAPCKVVVLGKPVSSMTLDKTKIDIVRGQKDTLKVRISPTNATDKTIVWTSDNEEIVEVSSEGIITALKVGKATITAKSNNNIKASASCQVSVSNPVQSISLDKTTVEIDIGERDTLTATVSPIDADNTNIIWTSSDEKIATVSDGIILGIKKGDITITATSKSHPLIKAICQVKILNNRAEITSFAFLDRSIETETLTRTKTPYTESFSMEAIINEEAKMIILRSAYFDALSSFSKVQPVFSLSTGASVKVGGTTQESGKTEVDFSSGSVQYVVTAEDGKTTQTYTVSIGHHDYAYIPDENFRAWLTIHYNGAMKGDSLNTVHTSVTSAVGIDVKKQNIAELTGIGFFVNIDTLQCDSNNLTSLDMTKNVALKKLYCNLNIIASIDVTKNKALEELYCSWNNLKSLDLSQNTALEELDCSLNTSITSLDVTQNKVLKKLNCNWNPLPNLDVTKNILLKELYCSNNNGLKSIDLSQNTALKTLYCNHDNGLKSLDLSKNTKLIYLACVSNDGLTSLDLSKNIALETLYCAGNDGLKSLDLSKNTLLKKLTCGASRGLISINLIKNTALTYLNCSENPALINLDLTQNTALKQLWCKESNLSSLDLSKNTVLTTLSFGNVRLDSIDLRGMRTPNSFISFTSKGIQQLTSVYIHENLQNHQKIKDIKTERGNNVIIKTYSAAGVSTTYVPVCCDYDPLKNTNPCNTQATVQGTCQ